MDAIINAYELGYITKREMMGQLLGLGYATAGYMNEEQAHEWLTKCLHTKIENAWSEAFEYVKGIYNPTSHE